MAAAKRKTEIYEVRTRNRYGRERVLQVSATSEAAARKTALERLSDGQVVEVVVGGRGRGSGDDDAA
jgi:hypothetical protein